MPAVARLHPAPGALVDELRRRFGFADFRPGQAEVIAGVLAGEDRLVVRPTGSGKSLCYQLPALLLPGLTVVVSPLIALMKDQVDALAGLGVTEATFINSSQPAAEQRQRLGDCLAGRYRLLYVAPERFRLTGFLSRLQSAGVQRFVVDEAHCISEWGHDFRPDYRRLREVLAALGEPPLVALTATATADVQQDILEQLGRPAAPRDVSGFNRPNLSFEVRHAADEAMKWRHLDQLLPELPGSGIIYAATRRQTEAVAAHCAQRAEREVVCYHAGLNSEQRSDGQDQFMAGADTLVVATTAFGMGVDKPGVRFVLHFSLPATVEAYYQQAGRAGRDGLPARCILLYDPADRDLQAWFIEHDRCPPAAYGLLLEALAEGTPVESLQRVCEINDSALRQALHELESLGAVVDSGLEPRRYDVVRRSLSAAERKELQERQSRHELLRRRQLEQMCRYAELGRGRRAFLLAYFGDATPVSGDEAARDDPPRADPDPRRVTPEESDVARAMLTIAAAARGGLGRARLVQLLRGSKARDVAAWQRNLPGYGRLAAFRAEVLREAMDQLILIGLLNVTGHEFPVVQPTEAGLAVLADPRRLIELPQVRTAAPTLVHAEGPKDRELLAADALIERDEAAFELLRAWRREEASRLGIAPFMILHDRTLRAVAQVKPSAVEDLLTIPGIGPHKAERYGPAIVAAVAGSAAPPEPAAPAPAGAWRRVWTAAADEPLDELLERLGQAVRLPELALIVPADDAPQTLALALELSRRHAVPVNHGLRDPEQLQRAPLRWVTPLLAVGSAEALAELAGRLPVDKLQAAAALVMPPRAGPI